MSKIKKMMPQFSDIILGWLMLTGENIGVVAGVLGLYVADNN